MISEILVFEIAGQRYGLPLADVQELLRAVTITPLPKAPAIIEGIIDVRGATIPVLDIRARFRLPRKEIVVTDHLILARANERLVALRVDRALYLASVADSQMEEAQKISPAAELITGVARLPDGMVLIHDLAGFLTEAEATALADAIA